MKMWVDFCWHETIHPGSDNLTTVELARILEENNEIVANFAKYAEKIIDKKICDWLTTGRTVTTSKINNELQQMWREYGRADRFGISRAAAERGDPAFVDTSTYMLDMYPLVRFDARPSIIIDDTGSMR